MVVDKLLIAHALLRQPLRNRRPHTAAESTKGVLEFGSDGNSDADGNDICDSSSHGPNARAVDWQHWRSCCWPTLIHNHRIRSYERQATATNIWHTACKGYSLPVCSFPSSASNSTSSSYSDLSLLWGFTTARGWAMPFMRQDRRPTQTITETGNWAGSRSGWHSFLHGVWSCAYARAALL